MGPLLKLVEMAETDIGLHLWKLLNIYIS